MDNENSNQKTIYLSPHSENYNHTINELYDENKLDYDEVCNTPCSIAKIWSPIFIIKRPATTSNPTITSPEAHSHNSFESTAEY